MMSGHHSHGTPAKVRKSSPNSTKQGPMKATIPISSVFKNPNSLRHISPTLSPTSWKSRISPDHPSGQRSPGSTLYKVKSKPLGKFDDAIGSVIRRTASLDTIYLKGQWPRDSFYLHTSFLQVDKATQTEDSDILDLRKVHNFMDSADEKLEKMMIRQRLQRNNNKDTTNKLLTSPYAMCGSQILTLPSTSSQTNSTYITSPIIKASPINIPIKPLPKPMIRNSVEGLNQEIERLVLKNTGVPGSQLLDKNEEYDKFFQVTPEGHRAPLAELLKSTRSIDTQTPAGCEFVYSCPSSGESQTSSPDQESSKLGTSPHINRFLAREPPDGCEKVHLKSLDELKGLTVDKYPRPSTFQLKPSLGSAFQLLQPNINTSTDRDLPLVPSQKDSN